MKVQAAGFQLASEPCLLPLGLFPARILILITHALVGHVNWNKETSTEELPLSDGSMGLSVSFIFTNGWCSGAQPTVGFATSGQVVPGYTRQQAE